MNLNSAPTKEQLRELLSQCNDRTASHVLWVDPDGNVHLTEVAEDRNGSQPATNMCLRYETFLKGNEYVGPEAARDEQWLDDLFQTLLRAWPRAKGNQILLTID